MGATVGAVFLVLVIWGLVRLNAGKRKVPIRVALIGGIIGVAVGVVGLLIAAVVMLGIAFSGSFTNGG